MGVEKLRLVDPASHYAEPFRTLRLTLRLADAGRSSGVLFTSAEPGIGKSTLAANFARICVAAGDSVLAVDADLRRSTLHTAFAARSAPGLVEALTERRQEISSYVQRTSVGVDLLAAGSGVNNTGDAMASGVLTTLLEGAVGQYEVVVVDAPPVLAAADAASLAASGRLDVVFVIARSSKRRQVREALHRLKLVDARIVGFAVNRDGGNGSYEYSY